MPAVMLARTQDDRKRVMVFEALNTDPLKALIFIHKAYLISTWDKIKGD